jgi:spermidine dehydrogenase
MQLEPGAGLGQNYDAIRHPEAEDYSFHFPDGNASVARLLVRRLIPGAIAGSTMDDVITAKVDYGRLDKASAPVRIRLNSTVVRVRHERPAASAKGVGLVYVRGASCTVCGHVPRSSRAGTVPSLIRVRWAPTVRDGPHGTLVGM